MTEAHLAAPRVRRLAYANVAATCGLDEADVARLDHLALANERARQLAFGESEEP